MNNALSIDMKALITTFLFLLFINTSAFSEERKVKLGTEHRFITTGAKLTGGSLSTLAGYGNLFFIPVLKDTIGLGAQKEKESFSTRGEHIQPVYHVVNPLMPGMGYSWGLIQVNDYDSIEAHEIGHSTATDTMGPLIIPYGIYDYIKRGHSHKGHSTSNLERWADMESLRDPYAIRRFNVGFYIDDNLMPGVSFRIVDEASYDSHQTHGDTLHQDKRFEFLNTRVGLAPECEDCMIPVNGNFDLSTYLTRMTIGDGPVRALFEGNYKLLSMEKDDDGDLKADLITSENSACLKFIISPSLSAYMMAGIGSRMTLLKPQDEDLSFDVMLGVTARGGIIISDLFELSGGHREYFGLDMDVSQSHIGLSRHRGKYKSS